MMQRAFSKPGKFSFSLLLQKSSSLFHRLGNFVTFDAVITPVKWTYPIRNTFNDILNTICNLRKYLNIYGITQITSPPHSVNARKKTFFAGDVSDHAGGN